MGSNPSHATNFMLDTYRQHDIAGFSDLHFVAQGSVTTIDPSVHVYFLNEGFDEEFVIDVGLALEGLRSRIKSLRA